MRQLTPAQDTANKTVGARWALALIAAALAIAAIQSPTERAEQRDALAASMRQQLAEKTAAPLAGSANASQTR
jgi:dTDP-4-amino-4,6-dideoxygalactose transaminase